MANEAFHLEWHGPYAIVDGANDPNLFAAKPAVARSRGVYAWTVPVGDEYWVYYIGKAEDQYGLLARLRAEARRKEPKRCYIDDTELLLHGERVPLYRPRNSRGEPDEASWQSDPDRFTACSDRFRQIVRIFVAPMADARKLIRFAEGALIHAVADYEYDNWGDRPNDAYYFLACADNGPRRPTGPYRITMSLPAKIRGFEQIMEYTEPRVGY
jgi:hypothetical protein